MIRYIVFAVLALMAFCQSLELCAQGDDVRRRVQTGAPPARENVKTATGTIRGQVYDGETGEPMPQAMVVIPELQGVGAYADLDGNYSIENVPPGTYTVRVTYVTYEDLAVQGVAVTAGEVELINLKMQTEESTTTEIIVESKQIKNTEGALLTLQRVAPVTLDGITSQQTTRNGDTDAASSLRRVTGVTVEGGRYVYVRGLGDRYNKTLVNGAQVPGLDPSRNSVQMDMFPTNIIDNVIIYKAFAPNLPGDFTGGLIDINTKDFPEKFTLQLSTSFAYNDQATFNDDFLLYEGSSTDWLGFDSGARDEPEFDGELPVQGGLYNSENPSDIETDRVTREFGGQMFPTRQNAFFDHSHQISVGDQIQLGKKPLGFIATLSYRRRFQFYDNGRESFFQRPGQQSTVLVNSYNFSDTRGEESVLAGALLTFSYKFSANHKLNLTYNHNHAGESSARYQNGTVNSDAIGQFRENRVMQYLERSIDAIQLRGEHYFKNLGRAKVEWISSLVFMKQDEPDLRFFSNQYELDENGNRTQYSINTAQYDPPTRFFRNLNELNTDNRLHITVPVRKEVSLKAGGAYSAKLRVPFEERMYRYDGERLIGYGGNEEAYWAASNLGANYETGQWQLYVKDQSDPRNTYDGTEQIVAGYVMGDIKPMKWLRFVTGVRVESTNSRVESAFQTADADVGVGEIETVDLLPCFNVIFSPKEDVNIRLNYGRTIARPIMREMALYSNFDFIGGYLISGNNDLNRTLIDNLDLRLEWFPQYNEIISISAFYKFFQDPIERAIDSTTTSNNAYVLRYRNVDEAVVFGLEFEIKKHLGFIADPLKNFRVGLNTSLINSRIDIDEGELAAIRAVDPDAEDFRPMYAQSPYIVNANLAYINDTLGTSVTVNYNVFGQRLVEVGRTGTPNVYEQPRPRLDVNILQKINERWGVRVAAQNLLNPEYRFEQELSNETFTTRRFTVGRRFVLGVSYQIR